jgi:molecular chaperone HscB
MNYFEIFDLPVSPKINRSLLSKKYIELQKKNHPDFFTNSTESEQEDALILSSQINKGLKVLQNEDETIKYFLQLKGLLTEDEKYQLPPAFLMEMMELNEELSEGSSEQINHISNGLFEDIKPVIDNYSELNTPQSDLLRLKEYYYKKKYLQRILDRIAD